MFRYNFCSGWLTGKYTQNMADLPADTRVGWVSQVTERANQSHPDYTSQANDKKTWQVLGAMQDIAKTHGKVKTLQTMFNV